MPELRAVFAALGENSDVVRLVGGAVRNTLLGSPVTDLDLATRLLPQEVIERAESKSLKAVPTGLDHGTVTLIVDHHPFEVTTLRRDVATDGRHAEVQFTDDWKADAQRRDFTMNALYADASGKVYDDVGGLSDLADRRVRFIGVADERIEEDFLRILRFFRFFAVYGDGRPDADGLKACARLKEGLIRLSAERVWSEFKRLLSAPDPARSLLWMRTTGVLEQALPECWGIDALPSYIELERHFELSPDPLGRLEVLLPDDRGVIERLAARLRLSTAEKQRLMAWTDVPAPCERAEANDLEACLYRFGSLAIRDRWLVAGARLGAQNGGEIPSTDLARLTRQLKAEKAWQRPSFPVEGKDLISQGMVPGPDLGSRLVRLEEAWIASGFTLSREDLLKL